MVEVRPIDGLPEIAPGDDLVPLLRQAADFERGDIIVVTQKIVSKSLNLFADLSDVEVSGEAQRLADLTLKDPRLVELVLQESTDIVRAVPRILITRHHSGCVMANAGIDQSNIGPGKEDRVLLLPRNPDAVAQDLRTRLGSNAPAIIISDSFGRPWRLGVASIAIGAAGLPALVDMRGTQDRDGREMQVTQIALADMVACAAGLVMGEGCEGIPAALVRGLQWTAPDIAAAGLVRPLSEDLFQ